MKSALLMHGGALGDGVLALRLLAALRDRGYASVTVAARAALVYLAKRIGLAGATLDIDTAGSRAFSSNDPALGPFDVVVDLLGLPSAAKTTKRYLAVDPRPRPGRTRHITRQWFADLRDAGLRLAWPAEEALLRSLRKPGATGPILLHPGSGGRDKCWPLERYLVLASLLAEDGQAVEAVLGPVEMETWGASQRAALSAAMPVHVCDALPALVEFLSVAAAFVGNDSGPTHVASEMGLPTIALFGPTRPQVWGPLGPRTVIAMSDDGWPEAKDVADLLTGD